MWSDEKDHAFEKLVRSYFVDRESGAVMLTFEVSV